MLYLVKMAFRNISRNRRRSILALSSVGLSLLLIVFAQGFIGGAKKSVITNSIQYESGHIQISTRYYFQNKRFLPITDNIQNPEEIRKLLLEDPVLKKEIDLINERMSFGILLQNSGNNKGVLGIAGDAENEKSLLMLQKSIVDGSYFGRPAQEDVKKREIIIGKKIADALKLKVGDEMEVLVSGSDYALHIPTLKVIGIFRTGFEMFDDQVFQMRIEDAKEVLNTGGSVQQMIVMLKDYTHAQKVADRIQALFAQSEQFQGLEVVPWNKAGGYAEFMESSTGLYNAIYFVIAFLGAVIITNIMMMVIFERRKEIGILKSMGFKRFEILMLFLIEGTTLGAIGSFIGIVLGSLFSIYFIIQGINFGASLSSVNVPMNNVIRFTFSISGIITAMFIGIIVASLVSILPARQAAKMNAVDAIRSV